MTPGRWVLWKTHAGQAAGESDLEADAALWWYRRLNTFGRCWTNICKADERGGLGVRIHLVLDCRTQMATAVYDVRLAVGHLKVDAAVVLYSIRQRRRPESSSRKGEIGGMYSRIRFDLIQRW
jgi:hypothetical protein